jgi:predicted nuclease of predicted toxin-antitoxin system
MRILLDECVNPRLREAFTEHEVKTVRDMGWGGFTNGRLLALAQRDGFEVFVTVDQNMPNQQNVAALGLGLLIVAVPDNNMRFYRPLFLLLQRAVTAVGPGEVVRVDYSDNTA